VSNRSQAWLEAVALRPDLVARQLEVRCRRAEQTCEAMARLGFPFIQGGGDFASNSGPNYSPRAFHELMAPRLKRITAACNRYGGYHMFASDGNLWPVADDLFDYAGIDAFYEVDGMFMDLHELRRRYPHLTLLGNICSATLHKGTKEQVVAETRACMEAAEELGSIIVGCSNQIVAGTPEENFWAMMETMHALK
jgi:uroporphyrinogen-III decarboxylase